MIALIICQLIAKFFIPKDEKALTDWDHSLSLAWTSESGTFTTVEGFLLPEAKMYHDLCMIWVVGKMFSLTQLCQIINSINIVLSKVVPCESSKRKYGYK